ncbi:MAG: MBL fold metallo-hydrolase [Anaerolineales bacterium]|nr:MBL fold metallo-hydrolase [Anaerolineales bacterium]
MQHIERGIIYEDSFLGVTVGALAFQHGVILIDAPLKADDTRSWRSTLINQRGGSNRLLVSLDAHPDRTLGARLLDCTMIAHQKTARVFRNRSTIFKGQSVESGADWETYPEAIGLRWASPDITFTERITLHWGGPEVILEHHPGPTPGSIWVIIPDMRVVFVGDAVVLRQPPFLAWADLDAWIGGLDMLMNSYQDYVIVSGRGGQVVAEDIRRQIKVLKEIANALDNIARKNAAPEDNKVLIPKILAHYADMPAEHLERYTQRLRYGLHQCFLRRYRSVSLLGQTDVENEEQ